MSMRAPDRKKQIETYYTEEARCASPIFPKGELVPHEGPDFLLRGDSGIIGIEVTQLCREEPRAEAGRLAKIPEKAKARYSQLAAAVPVDVSLAFSRHAASLTSERLVKSVVEFVYARRNSKGISWELDVP